MKIICTQENLIKGLNIVSHIAGKNVSLPILNNILIKAQKGVFNLVSTNLDIGIKTTVRGKIEKEGELTAQARLLTEYVSFLPGGNVELEKKESDIVVKAGKQEATIKGQEAEEYPIVPDIGEVKGISIGAKELREALSEVIFSASYEDIRPELSGVLVTVKNSSLTLVATDSYRLSEKTIKVEKEGSGMDNLSKIIPLRVLQEIVRIIGERSDKVEIGFNENQVFFRVKETIVISRLIEGNYPDYKEIIPKEYKTKVVCDRVDLIKIIKTASLFSKAGINDVLLEFSKKDGEILISSTNIQLGENKASLVAEITGEEKSVVFNYKYLLDGLQNMPGKKIVLELTSGDAPVILKPETDKDYLYLIMPIRK